MRTLLCWLGIHPRWYEERRYVSDALIIDWMGTCHAKNAVNIIDHCPYCNARWKSLLGPKGTKDFTERVK